MLGDDESGILSGLSRSERRQLADRQRNFEEEWAGDFAAHSQLRFSTGHSPDGHWVGLRVDTRSHGPVHVAFTLGEAFDLLASLQFAAAAALETLENGSEDAGRS